MPPARQRTLNKADTVGLAARRPAKRTASFRTKAAQAKDAAAAPVKQVNIEVPGADIAFKVFMSARICAALWSHITDCDETYNYWEPLHYLIYGHGLQTWEYSPEFALRSYTYLLIHGVPAFIYNRIFQTNPILVFYFVRCLLALCCASVEVYFYKAVCREFGIQVGRLWMLFQLFSPGMYIASTALLPSSFSMYLCSAALAAWWHQNYRLSIFFIAIASLLGWPFAALIGLPICFDILVRQRYWRTFLLWSAISAITILVPMLLIDSTYFGKFTVAPLNIIAYNVFTSHGPNLYGTEPASFYFLNGLLNFNIIWPLALATPVALVLGYFFVPARSKATLFLPHCVSLAPFYIWLAVFIVQPHKEERFLFPVYFLVGLCAAITTDTIQKLYFRVKGWIVAIPTGSHYLDHATWISAIVMIVTTLMGLSKISSLYFNYHSPLDLMTDMNYLAMDPNAGIPPNVTYNVCVGKDWYRFPGSFFLPSKQFRLRFLKSEFGGILPAYFDESVDYGTTTRHSYFNDLNQANDSMYFNYDECHFLFDLDTKRYTELEPNYGANTSEWTLWGSYRFLDASRSSSIFRSFYVPWISDQYVQYANLNLFHRTLSEEKTKSIFTGLV